MTAARPRPAPDPSFDPRPRPGSSPVADPGGEPPVDLATLEAGEAFADRHIGPSGEDQARMLAAVGVPSVPALLDTAVPPGIRTARPLAVPPAGDESTVLGELRELAGRNRVLTSMIGLGYHGTVTPPVIARNVLENPAWYTAYTPYQPEISQGRLEALLTFQTMVADLTGLPVAGASLLDEATAAAEAMLLARRTAPAGSRRDGRADDAPVFVVDADTLPQTLAVLATRAAPVGIDLVVADLTDGLDRAVGERAVFGVLVSYPSATGRIIDHSRLVEQAHARGALVAVAADPLALTLLRPPGEVGADIAVGSTQRFGVPMGFGGPHAAYIAVRTELTRSLPGRLVGVSVDADGRQAYRLALQTREQHIRRERATSNICTAQVLLAVVAGFYAAWHGPAGLARIARRAHRMAAVLAAGLRAGGVPLVHDAFFDTLIAHVPGRAAAVLAAARTRGINLRPVDADHVGITTDETTTRAQLAAVWAAFGVPVPDGEDLARLDADTPDALPDWARRTSPFLTHPVFHAYHSEAAMVRYLRRLADADLALDRTMIPLGSCTMKLNAAAEMAAMTWPEFAGLHPFAPLDQAGGTLAIIDDLTRWLADLTGYDAVSLQPNAGSQGELAGLLAIRAYHLARGQAQRTVCLIPASAHGTNAASAVLAGMRVVVVACDAAGNIDLDDLRATLAAHADEVAAIMITYPSTHGVYEASIAQIAALVHDAGGQVYVDGANLNALVGIARPGEFGADVSHLNLHKTFTIPHGGGGPGVGPIGVRAHLAPYLPNHPVVAAAGPATGVGPVAAAPWGSAGILQISWAYLRLMGPDGLTRATGAAVLAANYLARRLAPAYPVLYTGPGGLVAHECILDLRPLTRATGVTVDDVAKRLIDFGFHAPTVSFPVPGTLMVEPTESEDLAELDRFVDAMLAIRAEIDALARGELDPADNPLRNAPHTASMLTGPDGWTHPYPAAQGVFPVGSVAHADPAVKYWPPVRRIDQAYGDRHLVCSCPPISAYAPDGRPDGPGQPGEESASAAVGAAGSS